MEELAKIITAISDVTGLDQHSIKFGKTDECKEARDILCYIALKDRYGLTWTLMEVLNFRKSQVYFSADRCQEKMKEDLSFLKIMNEVRKKLSLAPILTDKIEEMKEKEKERKRKEAMILSNKNAKRIFGIEYTKKDNENIQSVSIASVAFMREYCRIGRKVNPKLCE